MNRRSFLAVSSCVLATVPAFVLAQQPKTYRIGYLHPTDSSDVLYIAFVQALKGLGYGVGGDTIIEARFAESKVERLPGLAADLVAKHVDVIVAVAISAIQAARVATQTIPIVMAFSSDDPVKSGFAATLAHPGGNITGVTSVAFDIAPKWIELLQVLVPGLKTVGVLRAPGRPDHTAQVDVLRHTAEARGIRLNVVEAGNVDQFAEAFAAMASAGSQAAVVLTGPAVVSGRARVVELATSHRLPAVYQFSYFVADGGLISYGPNLADLSARGAVYVDKILRGAKPADLPIEQPTKFELTINLKTARAIGITIPQALQLRADSLIQ
jgi:ABC-type uncharacterized transport system substrate-binding protein